MAAHVRDLRGVIEREKAEIGVLVSVDPPTKPTLKEAAEAGFYQPPRLAAFRFCRIAELLAGKKIGYPEPSSPGNFRGQECPRYMVVPIK